MVVGRLVSVDEAQVDFEVKLRSLAQLIERSLPSSGFGKLLDTRKRYEKRVLTNGIETVRTHRIRLLTR